jgi:rRNA small subunit pseudouridine methyltransferase Nep1
MMDGGRIKFFPPHGHGSPMLHLVFAESALERVPSSLWGHPSVINRARAVGKHPGNVLLDRTYHHRAMVTLPNAEKRGRPDILHVSLLAAFGTPLNKEGLLHTYVHTRDDHLIHFRPDVRLPKNYSRFVGLLEQLYEEGIIPVNGPPLLTLTSGRFQTLIDEVQPSHVIAFSRRGRPTLLHEALDRRKEETLMVVVGAFPHGHFSEPLMNLVDEVISIDVAPLETWIVASRILYDYERALGLPAKRLSHR